MFDAFTRWWHRPRPQTASRRRTIRLQLESLEGRQLPTAGPLALSLYGALHAPVSHSTTTAAQQNVPILASAHVSLNINAPAQQLVIKSAADLQAQTGLTEAQLDRYLGVSSINWSSQMLVMVSQGHGAYGAFSPHVKITDLSISGGTLTVDWHLERPNPNQIFPMYMMITDPAELVLVQRFDGPVQFHQGATITLPPPSPIAPLAPGIFLPMPAAKAVSTPGVS
jgi:hypothetical protein